MWMGGQICFSLLENEKRNSCYTMSAQSSFFSLAKDLSEESNKHAILQSSVGKIAYKFFSTLQVPRKQGEPK